MFFYLNWDRYSSYKIDRITSKIEPAVIFSIYYIKSSIYRKMMIDEAIAEVLASQPDTAEPLLVHYFDLHIDG